MFVNQALKLLGIGDKQDHSLVIEDGPESARCKQCFHSPLQFVPTRRLQV